MAVTTDAYAEGRYEVERLLGHGGMAAVYLARDRELGRPVAVKVLAEPYAHDEEFVRRFRREAQVAAGLAHANIVQVYDAGEEDERLFIVMEYVEGERLDEVIDKSGALDPARAVELGQQACSALEYAHREGVVHRDVKPANLLLRSDGILKVADFGIARPGDATELTQVGTVLGTAAYLAPEQAGGEPATPASDLYSLGVVLYELLTGEPPYRVENMVQLPVNRAQPIRPVRDLAPDVPGAVEAAVMRCLARNPRYRPGSAAELAADLRLRDDAPTVPLGRTAATRLSTSSLRHSERIQGRWLATRYVVFVALLFVVIAFSAVLLSGRNGNGTPAPARSKPVRGVPAGATPADQARNLADWIRQHAGR